MGLMLKSEFEAQREKKLLQSLVGTLNGNIGAGVAVAGAFSLVRFRSAPGTARAPIRSTIRVSTTST